MQMNFVEDRDIETPELVNEVLEALGLPDRTCCARRSPTKTSCVCANRRRKPADAECLVPRLSL